MAADEPSDVDEKLFLRARIRELSSLKATLEATLRGSLVVGVDERFQWLIGSCHDSNINELRKCVSELVRRRCDVARVASVLRKHWRAALLSELPGGRKRLKAKLKSRDATAERLDDEAAALLRQLAESGPGFETLLFGDAERRKRLRLVLQLLRVNLKMLPQPEIPRNPARRPTRAWKAAARDELVVLMPRVPRELARRLLAVVSRRIEALVQSA